MDPTLATLQTQMPMGTANEAHAEVPIIEQPGAQPDAALAAKFQALMSGADGAGVPTAPVESSGAIAGSPVARIIESQDSIMKNAFEDVLQLRESAPFMSVMENMNATTQVATEVAVANFQMTVNVNVANGVKSSVETLMKNQ
ncbi:hypothetical protein LJR230_002180 [Trinickia sp. LjRoot230]|uniref:hypothetical protein n=1 Tax=Trinickia sp. LjRoot230 TaxID=3342288 RepID=UPI003ECC40C1